MGNDETVWEAPGYEVPFLQTVRMEKMGFPFPEYHSELDTPELIKPGGLEEFFEVYRKGIEVIETNTVPKRCFEGLIALSNPEYDLYFNRIDPAIHDGERTYDTEKWGHLQDCVFRYLDGDMSVLEIAERHGLDFFEVRDYLNRWAEKGLVEMKPFIFDRSTRRTVEPLRMSFLED